MITVLILSYRLYHVNKTEIKFVQTQRLLEILNQHKKNGPTQIIKFYMNTTNRSLSEVNNCFFNSRTKKKTNSLMKRAFN